jgi:hypothetical protein
MATGGGRGAAFVGRQRGDAHAAAALDDEVQREPSLEDSAGRAIGGVDERALHLGAGGRTSGVDDTGA